MEYFSFSLLVDYNIWGCQVVSDMSVSKTSPGNAASNAGRRNLPSWISSQENENESRGKKAAEACEGEKSNEGGKAKQAKGHAAKENNKTSASSSATTNFSKLLVLNKKLGWDSVNFHGYVI